MQWSGRMVTAAALALAACNGGLPRADHAGAPGGPPPSVDQHEAAVQRDIERVRAATTGYHVLDSAVAAGYPRSVPRCLSHAELGGMGFHHVNSELLDDSIDVERPEILLYSRTESGQYVLNGVEYIVPYSARPPESTPPTVMGQQLKRSDALRLWYLHVWAWKENASGLFADWNPAVECRP